MMESFTTGINDTPPPDAGQWSDRAVQRLTWLRAGGLLMILIGAAAFAAGTVVPGFAGSFLENGGLTLLVTGLVIIVAAVRTRGAQPNRLFATGSIVKPRMWFILIWLVGSGVSVIVLALNVTATTEQIVMLFMAVILMVMGGFWLLRWLSGQLTRRWPIVPTATLKLVPGWTIMWAGVWGLISTILAFIVEGLPLLLLALLAGTAFREVPRSTVGSPETIVRVLRNPVLIVLAVIGAVVVAPIIEEALKALGLHWLRGWIRQPSDGWLLGLGAGLGFGVLEGAFNLDAAGGWFVGSWVRLAALLLHGLTTSLVGLGYARSLRVQQRGPLWRGYRNAVITHGLWNASALGIGVAAGALGVGAFSIRLFVACSGLLLLAGLIVFMILLLRRVSRAGVETSIQEDLQWQDVSMPPDWTPMKFNLGWRLVGAHPMAGAPVTAASAVEASPVQSSGMPTSDREIASTDDEHSE